MLFFININAPMIISELGESNFMHDVFFSFSALSYYRVPILLIRKSKEICCDKLYKYHMNPHAP